MGSRAIAMGKFPIGMNFGAIGMGKLPIRMNFGAIGMGKFRIRMRLYAIAMNYSAIRMGIFRIAMRRGHISMARAPRPTRGDPWASVPARVFPRDRRDLRAVHAASVEVGFTQLGKSK